MLLLLLHSQMQQTQTGQTVLPGLQGVTLAEGQCTPLTQLLEPASYCKFVTLATCLSSCDPRKCHAELLICISWHVLSQACTDV